MDNLQIINIIIINLQIFLENEQCSFKTRIKKNDFVVKLCFFTLHSEEIQDQVLHANVPEKCLLLLQ